MDYSTFKSLQILLFFGSAIAFCAWQLRSVQRLRRQRIRAKRVPEQRGRRNPDLRR